MEQTYIASIWDDGLESDLILIEILRKYNATASFAISPATHKNYRTLNDSRHSKYGKKVSIQELKEFSSYELINHTATHPDLSGLDYNATMTEIKNGKDMLEDQFSRAICGFCYPYGCSNQHCEKILAETKHIFARTTQGHPISAPHYHYTNPYQLHPTCKWDYKELLSLIDNAKKTKGHLIFWGHTYEMETSHDWDAIKNLYSILCSRSDVKLVSLEELTNNHV